MFKHIRDHKTKIVATIGPASESPEMLERLIRAGMDVARLNFSHGTLEEHAVRVERIRAAERESGFRVAVMADLPGPKMRVGLIDPEPISLIEGAEFRLTPEDVRGGPGRVSVTFERLPEVVKPGDRLFLNDGLIELRVDGITGRDVVCRVVVGGELRSRKGLNLPGIRLGISAFTEHDRECLEYALGIGVDAVSQSFVETADDIEELRSAIRRTGKDAFVIAKIERSGALEHIDEILKAADGIMVARGDLGVEVPLERIALTQKHLIAKANFLGKPVITATQMLESMVESRLPTRAEATDVANAILDGTDCVMLSAESAVGRFPEEAVEMLSRIAAVAEAGRSKVRVEELRRMLCDRASTSISEAVASMVETVVDTPACTGIFVPTRTGTTPRMISRMKPRAWTLALSESLGVCRALQFSYGVLSVRQAPPADWKEFTREWRRVSGQKGRFAALVTGPSPQFPDSNLRIEFILPDLEDKIWAELE